MMKGVLFMDRRLKTPTILEANFFYLIVAFLLIFWGGIVQQWDLYKGLIITEYIIILLPTVFFIIIRSLITRGNGLKKVLRLNPISLKQAILIPLITLLSYPIGVFLNYIGILIISNLGRIKESPLQAPESGTEFLIGLFVIAISAGICEEVMFRGLMMKAYERLGKKKAIIITAILFGVFHFNPQNLLGPIFLGLLFGILLIKTNSIFATMIAHATNNAIALTLQFGLNKLDIIETEQSMEALEQLSNMPIYTQLISYAFAIFFWGSIVIGCGFAVYFLIKALPKPVVSEEQVRINEPHEGLLLNQIQSNNIWLKLLTVLPLIIASILYIWLGYMYIIF